VDASTDAGWTPQALPGLAIWLNDDVGVVRDPTHTSAMLRWLDQSGHNNTATVQANQRYFEVDPQVANGHDAYHCPGNGSVLVIADDPSLQWGTGGFAIGVVYEADQQMGFWQKDAQLGNGLDFSRTSTNDLALWIGGVTVVLAPQGNKPFHAAITRGPKMEIFEDGFSAAGPTTALDVSNTGTQVRICNGTGTSQNLEIAEVVAVKGSLSDADLAQLQSYFKAKFGL
jgi:hypothetical protein